MDDGVMVHERHERIGKSLMVGKIPSLKYLIFKNKHKEIKHANRKRMKNYKAAVEARDLCGRYGRLRQESRRFFGWAHRIFACCHCSRRTVHSFYSTPTPLYHTKSQHLFRRNPFHVQCYLLHYVSTHCRRPSSSGLHACRCGGPPRRPL